MEFAACLKEDLRSEKVLSTKTCLRLTDAAVDIRFAAKLTTASDLPYKRLYEFAIPDVASNESVTFLAAQVLDILKVPGVGQLVHVGDSEVRVL